MDNPFSRRDFLKLAAVGFGAMAFRPFNPEASLNNDYSRIFDNDTLAKCEPVIEYKDLYSYYTSFKLKASENNQFTKTLQNRFNVDQKSVDGASVSWLVETGEIDSNQPSSKLWDVNQLNLPESEIALITLKNSDNYIAYSTKNNNVCFFDPSKLVAADEEIFSCSIIKGGCVEIFTSDRTLIAVFDGIDRFNISEEIFEPFKKDHQYNYPWNTSQNISQRDKVTRIIYTNDLRLYRHIVDNSRVSVEQINSGDSQIFDLPDNNFLVNESHEPLIFSFKNGVGYFKLQKSQSETKMRKLHFSVLESSRNSDIATNVEIDKLYKALETGTYRLNVTSDTARIQQIFTDNKIKSLLIGLVSISHGSDTLPWISIGLNDDGSIDLNENQDIVQTINGISYPEVPEIYTHPSERII